MLELDRVNQSEMRFSGIISKKWRSTNYPLILSAICLCALSFFAFRHEVDQLKSIGFVHFPHEDDWDTPLHFLAFGLNGTPLEFLSELLNQHNESRKVTLKLLTLATETVDVFYSDLTVDISFFIRAVTVLVVSIPLFASSLSYPLWWPIRLAAIGYCLKVYAIGPANLYNGLWYVQNSFFMGLLFSASSITSLSLAFHLRRSKHAFGFISQTSCAILAGIAGFLAVFSFAGNFALLPVAVAMILLFSRDGGLKSRIQGFLEFRESKIILLSLASSIILFFIGYQSPPGHAQLRSSIPNPLYVINFLTNCFRPGGNSVLAISQIFTTVFLILLACWCLATIFGYAPARISWPSTPLVGQLLFLVALAVLSSLGRGGGGPGYALFSERYNTMSLLVSCIVVILLTLLSEDLFAYCSNFISARISYRQVWGWITIALLAGNVLRGLHANEAWRPLINEHFAKRRTAVSCLKRYVSARREGIDSSRLTKLAECAKLLYPPGVENISQRYLGSWCETIDTNRSRTIKSLCRELRSSAPNPQV